VKKKTKKKSRTEAPVGHVRRFLAIIEAIRAGDFPNNVTLAEELGCTKRTVQHYTVMLRELGAPLDFDRERNGFYFSKEWRL
jgi:predicted DNA-binding transcriptional regulator YafY